MCRRILRNTEIKSPGPPAPPGNSGNGCWHGGWRGSPQGSHPVDGAPRLLGSGASPRSNWARLCPCRRASWLYLQSSRRNPPPGCSRDLGGTQRAGLTTWAFITLISHKSRCYFLKHKEKVSWVFFGSALTPVGSWDPNPGWNQCPHISCNGSAKS